MKILMVSPYPPIRDGIAAYAQQSVAALRAEGHDVEVLSPGPSAAHHHLELKGPRGAFALAKRVARYDLVILQFHPDFFYPEPWSARSRFWESLALTVAFTLARRVRVVVHETDYSHGRGVRPAAVATRLMWRSVDEVAVHSRSERESFISSFGVRPSRVEVVDHGQAFSPNSTVNRGQARASLGIDQGAQVFLSIGFVQPHKGFDRAVRAFAGLPSPSRLDVVGSVRVDEPAYLAYAEELEELVDATPGANLHLGYVSDEAFDRWIIACNTVILPYREIWSSGVLERARLLDRPVIATRVGGLGEQAESLNDVTLVDDDAGLRTAIWDAANQVRDSTLGGSWPGADEGRASIQEQIVARATRARGSEVLQERGLRVGSVSSTAQLRKLKDVRLPDPGSATSVRGFARKVVRKFTGWMLQPVLDQVNAQRRATIAAVEVLTQQQTRNQPPPQ